MKRDQIFILVKEHLAKDFEIPVDDIHPGANLFKDLDMDSIDTLDYIVQLEEELNIKMVEDELKKIRTVKDVVDYIMKYQPSE